MKSMKNKYYKVVYGFGQDNFISIDESELEKAMFAFITGKKVVLKKAVIDGSQISKILPDHHKTMGWNYGHKLDTQDWEEIGRLGNYESLIGVAGERVNKLIQSNQTHLIGTEPLPKIERAGLRGINELIKI